MIITHHGDIMYFICKTCGCRFQETVSKTSLDHAGVWDNEHKQHGVYMNCPDCGHDVIGFRSKNNECNEKCGE